MPKSSSVAAPGQLGQIQKNRKKQIEKLRQSKLGGTLTVISDVQYTVGFTLKHHNQPTSYQLKIDLPPSFPSEPPVLFVQPPCSHRYLDAAQLVIDFPPLESFKAKQDLSSVVRKLIVEFEKNPPIPLVLGEYETQQQEDILNSYAPQYPSLNEQIVALTISTNVMPSDPQNTTSSRQSYTGPKLPDIIPELEELTAEELKELDEDEIKLLGIFHSTELAKQFSREREEISKRIEAIANENLSRSHHLEECRGKLSERFEECKRLKDEYNKNVKKHAEASEWTSLHNLSLTLQVAAAEQEQKAEKLVEKFLDGNMDVSNFTKEFIKVKTVAVTRKVQEDKIQHILASH